MCKVICITNRALCREDFLTRIERIAQAQPDAILLREKDLPEDAYTDLARRVQAICTALGVPLYLHSYPQAALALGAAHLHLPLPVLQEMPDAQRLTLPPFGVSCHSLEDAKKAQALGASYLIAGHIFATDCKRGLPGRGTAFLRRICQSTSLPVYAIGGITPDNVQDVVQAGAAGVCVMSSLMTCDDPAALIQQLRGERIP